MTGTAADAAQSELLRFLRAFEDAQQDVLLDDVAAAQRSLADMAGDALPAAATALEALAPPAAGDDVGIVLEGALAHLRRAEQAFMSPRPWPDFAMPFLYSRGQQCAALDRLYRALDRLPRLEPYFRLEDRPPPAPATRAAVPVGVIHRDAGTAGTAHSLYVPESYDPSRRWPLVVCLHGGYGRGDEYLWTWLRIARSHGALLLSPKSAGATWSIGMPAADGDALLALIDALDAVYRIDPQRVLLTGLSDGATFACGLGLEHCERFTAVAPIAGVLSPHAEALASAGRGRTLPLHLVHGARDAIFPVATARAAVRLLESLGHAVHYTELLDWGHALTNRINERIVWPWFEGLGAG